MLNFLFSLAEKSTLEVLVNRTLKVLLHALFLAMTCIEDRNSGFSSSSQLKVIDIEQEFVPLQPAQHGFLYTVFQRQLFPKKPEKKSSVDIFVNDDSSTEIAGLDDLLTKFKAMGFDQTIILQHTLKSS
jgi:hypothetical protein